MENSVFNTTIVLRYISSLEIEESQKGSYILDKGEVVINTSTNGYRVGDGITIIKDLPEYGGSIVFQEIKLLQNSLLNINGDIVDIKNDIEDIREDIKDVRKDTDDTISDFKNVVNENISHFKDDVNKELKDINDDLDSLEKEHDEDINHINLDIEHIYDDLEILNDTLSPKTIPHLDKDGYVKLKNLPIDVLSTVLFGYEFDKALDAYVNTNASESMSSEWLKDEDNNIFTPDTKTVYVLTDTKTNTIEYYLWNDKDNEYQEIERKQDYVEMKNIEGMTFYEGDNNNITNIEINPVSNDFLDFVVLDCN